MEANAGYRISAVVLAETLINNGVIIDCDNESITWPFGYVSYPPSDVQKQGKGKATNKTVKSGKSGTIFGVLVNEIQMLEKKSINCPITYCWYKWYQ